MPVCQNHNSREISSKEEFETEMLRGEEKSRGGYGKK